MDRYVFLHVPKTAGSSLISIFRTILGPEEVGPNIAARFDEIDPADFARYRMVVGHLRYDQLRHFPGRRLLTFLRDPVDVIVSKYFYYRRIPDGAAEFFEPHVRLCRELPLPEFLQHAGRLKAFFNDAVWRFAGLGRHGPFTPESDALALARERLASCDFVGIYEELADSVDLMSYTFGWPHIDGIPRENATSGRKPLRDIDPGTIRKIAEANALDAELYRFGCALFEQRKREAWKTVLSGAGGPRPAPKMPEALARDGRCGTGEARILRVTTRSAGGGNTVRSGNACEIGVTVLANRPIDGANLIFRIVNGYDQVVYGTFAMRPGQACHLAAGEACEFLFRMGMHVAPGTYGIAVDLIEGEVGIHMLLDQVKVPLEVASYAGERFRGIVDLRAETSIQPCPALAAYRTGEPIEFARGGNAAPYQWTGWSTPEDWACWTDGPEAELLLCLDAPPARDLELIAEVHPFCPRRDLKVTVVANGTRAAEWRFERGEEMREVRAAIPGRCAPSGVLHLVFRIEHPDSPAQSQLSDDTRALGLAFRRLWLHARERTQETTRTG